jgi:hypothetical protein
MNPQGWFQGVTQLPKLVNTQALTGYSTHKNPKYTISLLSSLHNPREWTPFSAMRSLRMSTSFQGSSASSQESLCWDSQDSQLRIKFSTCQCILGMQAQIHGWNTPVISTSNKQWLLPQQFVPCVPIQEPG